MQTQDSEGSKLTPLMTHSGRQGRLATVVTALVSVVVVVFGLVVSPDTTRSAPVFEMAAPTTMETMPLLAAPLSASLPTAQGGADTVVQIEGNTLVAHVGPGGTQADAYQVDAFDQITTYIVREGDTLGHIAQLFDVSTNTIRWQNDMDSKGLIRPGQALVILPVDGVEHEVRKGDTLASIVKTYKGNLDEVQRFNNITDDSQLAAGMKIVVPGGEPLVPVKPKPTKVATKTTKAVPVTQVSTSSKKISSGYYIDPLQGAGTLTQSYHGRWRAIDIGAPTGTPIYAAAAGKVVVHNASGYGGGYGIYSVISHENGSKTLYAHKSRSSVTLGQYVQQGQLIGYVGNTGRSTGPHLHFEIRNGVDVPCVKFGRGVCR